MLIENPAKYPPASGWKERTVYLVDVAFNANNPVHRAMFFTGFLDERGMPAGYSKLFNPSYDGDYTYSDIHYMTVVRELLLPYELDATPDGD